jgi:hypothetical protein
MNINDIPSGWSVVNGAMRKGDMFWSVLENKWKEIDKSSVGIKNTYITLIRKKTENPINQYWVHCI